MYLLEVQALRAGEGVERFEPSSAMYNNTPVTPVTLQTTTQIKHQIPFYLDPK